MLSWSICACCVVALSARAASNFVVNGEFLAGLDGWESSGAVFTAGGSAALADDGVTRSLLYQGVELEAGSYVFGFDFREFLSAEVPPGRALDTFFATLYFSGSPELFDPADLTGVSGFAALLDLDVNGPRLFEGSVAPRPGGGGYSRYETAFTLPAPVTVFAVFDFVDLNGLNNDSLVLIANVTLIPEPSLTAAVLAGVAALLLLRRRRVRGSR